MKKWSIWIIITIMALSLCGCRPEAGVGAGSEGADTGGGQAEAAAQNTEATDTQGEQADGQTTEQTADTADTQATEENTETQPTENTEQPTENETETTTTTAEDPELRAEADRIRVEEGQSKYEEFCIEHDIKSYSAVDINADFAQDRVIVYLKKSVSAHNEPIPDFSCVDYESIEEATYYTVEPDGEFSRWFTIILKNKGKQQVLDAIQKLEQLEYVQSVNPSYQYYSG